MGEQGLVRPGAGEGILAEASLSTDVEGQGRREEHAEWEVLGGTTDLE